MMMDIKKQNWSFVVALLFFVGSVSSAHAWYDRGHIEITRLAVTALDKKAPAFFVKGMATIMHCSIDPDVFCDRSMPQLRSVSSPEHYFDLEDLKGHSLPNNRYAFLKLCDKMKLNPSYVGLLPYALTEWTQRLTLAFAEHRKWPNNPHIRMKCLVYAGILAHYAGDACQPLHATIHFDGRVPSGGKSPHSGIHRRMDDLLDRLQECNKLRNKKIAACCYGNLFKAVCNQIRQSNARVDRTYQLESKLPPKGGGWMPGPVIQDFGTECFDAGASFTASLFLTAWEKSAKIECPDWLKRTSAFK